MRFSSFLTVVGAAFCVLLTLAIIGVHGAQSSVDIQVTGAISMHHTRKTEGMTAMMPLDAVKVAPNMAVHFAQGGYHLMLIQPPASASSG